MKTAIVLTVVASVAAGALWAQVRPPPRTSAPAAASASSNTQVVAGLQADLALDALGFSPQGEILVTLANRGKTAINVAPAGATRGTPAGPPIQVDVYVGATMIQSVFQPALGGNAERVLTVKLQSNVPRCGESRPLRAVVDPQKVIKEASDDNNSINVSAASRPCPDLAIKSIERDFSGVLGETYSVRVRITNLGNAPAPKNQVWATSLPTGVWPVTGWPALTPTETIEKLDPGETTSFHVGGSVLSTSRTAVRVILDRDSQIDETNESNNFKDEWL
jgi:hypothetical protein